MPFPPSAGLCFFHITARPRPVCFRSGLPFHLPAFAAEPPSVPSPFPSAYFCCREVLLAGLIANEHFLSLQLFFAVCIRRVFVITPRPVDRCQFCVEISEPYSGFSPVNLASLTYSLVDLLSSDLFSPSTLFFFNYPDASLGMAPSISKRLLGVAEL